MKKYFTLYLFLLTAFATNAQTIVPTQTDEIIIDNGTSGKADPGDRIRYKVTIQNTGGPSGTNTQLNVVPDPRTTFVPGTFRSSPLAVADNYACTGNVGLNASAAQGVKANDFDDNLAGATVTAGTFATTQSGSIMLNADGSFMYTPPAGFTGTDTYTYTLNDANGVGAPVPTTDMGLITITVSNLIWFIDNSSVAATSDGRLSSPFKSLADFNAGSATAGDVVYIENTGTNYTGGIVLQNNERLFGEGHNGGANLSDVLPFALPANSKTLPTINGTRPVITNAAGHGITLASGNTIRGIEVGNVASANAKIFGNNFGTLTVGAATSDVLLSGTGQALNLTNGTFAASSKFISITSTSSGTQGMVLTTVAGTVDFGSTTISGNTTQGILVTASTANITFGNTTVSNGTDGVSLQNNSSGTRTFGTLTISGVSAVGFLHSVGGGTTTVTGATTITNPGGIGISIANSASTVTFAGTTVNKGASAGKGVAISNTTGNTTFASLDITTSNGIGLEGVDNTGQITVTSATGNISATSNAAIAISHASSTSPVNLNFSNVSSTNSSANGVTLTNVTGTYNAAGGSITGAAARGFAVSGGTIAITHGGSISGSTTNPVFIDNHDSGNITFQTGNITSTTQGIVVQNCNGGTIAFNNPSKSLTTGTNTGVNLTSNTGATINFGTSGLVISTTTGTGFNATGGGTVNVTGTGNTISSVSAVALNVSSTNIGASNMTFQSISAGNNTAAADPATGIALNTTGASGGLVVTGTGTTDGSGGTIQFITNRGVEAISTSNLSLKNMTFTSANLVDGASCNASDNSACNAAIYLNTVTNATLDNVDVNTTAEEGINVRNSSGLQLLNSTLLNCGTASSGGDTEEACLYAQGLSGTCAITSSSLTLASERAAVIYNNNVTMALTATSSTFGNTQAMLLGADGLEMNSLGSSNTTLDFVGCTFTTPKTNGLQVIGENTSVTSVDITGSCMFDPGPGDAAALDIVSNSTAVVNFNVIGNTISARSINVVNISGNGNSTMQGRINNNMVSVASGGTGSGVGIRVIMNVDSDGKVEINNNNISGIINDSGILTQASGGVGRLDAKVTNNTISVASTGAYHIETTAGASSSILTNKVCAIVSGNTTGVPAGILRNWRPRSATPSHELILQGNGATVTDYWNNNSNTPTTGMGAILNQSGAGVFTFTNVAGTCMLPTNPMP